MKRLYGILILLACCICLSGCNSKETKEPEVNENLYQIYYLNSAMTKIVPQDYIMPEAINGSAKKVTEWKINKIIEQLRTVPKNLDRQAAVPDKVGFKQYKLVDTLLYLYFDDNYAMMNPTREILCRAALVRSLTQINGVDNVVIYTADQPLMNKSGRPVGPMTDGDFIDNISNVNHYEKTELVLYFANEEGDQLAKETREVAHDVNTSLAKLVMEQLEAGPGRPGIKRTLPKDMKILNISVNENVCYLNFDDSFVNNNTTDVKEYIPIYSIVNSLAEVPTISKVQIMVNGSSDVMFRDVISLNQLFERNLDYNLDNSQTIKETGGNEQ